MFWVYKVSYEPVPKSAISEPEYKAASKPQVLKGRLPLQGSPGYSGQLAVFSPDFKPRPVQNSRVLKPDHIKCR
jgi:hypothetical protein